MRPPAGGIGFSSPQALLLLWALLALLAGGCASYDAAPLPAQGPLARSVAALRHDTTLPAALQVEDVARLALLNDPDLVAARTRHKVADAQLLQAGILPNPQLSLSATPTLIGPPGSATAWNAAVSQDLRAFILRPTGIRAARADLHDVDAQILWQEWQVVGQARLLAVQLIEEKRTLALLGDLQAMLARRVADRQQALAAGDATYATVAPDLAALADAETRRHDADRLVLQQRHALAALLGLAPDATLILADRSLLPPLDPAAIRAGLSGLGARRPDLLALRWGYLAADQRLRGALLSQFPALNFGANGGSDNTNVRGFGPQLTLDLPLFDRGQGRIAAAHATRAQLRAEYVARIAASTGEVQARLDELALLDRQIGSARAQLPAVRAAADAAARPDTASLLDPQARIDLISARTLRESELIALEQSRLEQTVAIETLAGIGMPTVTIPQPGATVGPGRAA